MGAVVGLLFGVGVLLSVLAVTDSGMPQQKRAPKRRLATELAGAGLADISPVRLAASGLGLGVAVFFLVAGVTGSIVVAIAFALPSALLPLWIVLRRAQRERDSRRMCWPDAVDDLASAVRAGMSLPEALAALGDRGPEPLRVPFTTFAADYRVTGSFGTCLNQLKAELADPVGDRVVEALRLARDSGGTDLGRLLRTLSQVLREDARTRAELETRQGWTVNAARLAVAAPWATLALLSLRPGALASYDSTAGAVVLGIAIGMSSMAYALMLRLGRLPREQRVLA